MLQPKLDIDEVTAFLEAWAGGPVGGVSQFSNGQVSSVFGFEVLGDFKDVLRIADPDASSGKYVARFVAKEHGGAVTKDRFIAPRAAAVGLPTPRLLTSGDVSMAVGNLPEEEEAEHSADS